MGMFDYIKCELPLPDGWDLANDAVGLQTKDFDCEMVEHRITKDGRLMLSSVERVEEVPKAERPFPEDDGFLGLCGSIRRHTIERDACHHGYVYFYGLEIVGQDDDGRDKYKSHDYKAKFIDGQLVAIEIDPE